jgi:hypothetical protein
MKRLLVGVAVLMVFTVPALCASGDTKTVKKSNVPQQKQGQVTGNKTPINPANNMTPGQKDAMLKQQEKQLNDMMASRKQLYEKNRAKLKDTLSKDKKLTQDQKDATLKSYDVREKQDEDNLAFFNKITNDTTMTREQKNAATNEHFKQQADENRKLFEGQRGTTGSQEPKGMTAPMGMPAKTVK